jgi:hypothetical protein
LAPLPSGVPTENTLDDDACEVPATPLPSRSSAGWLRWLIAIVLVLVAGVATTYRGLGRGLNHDENQFLSPGMLLSHEGLMPYRDYPLFHMPNLIYAYAAMDHMFEDPIRAAKMVSAISTTGVVALFFWLALARGGNVLRPWERLWAATAVSILWLFDPLFLFTSGKTWNHELPAFFIVLAAVFHVESFRGHRKLLCALSGIAAGLAAGTRLTYAPVCAAFLVHLAIGAGEGWRCRLKAIISWGIGCAIGLAPSFYFLIAHRDAFLFDNLKFPRLTLLDPENIRVHKTIRLSNKIRFLIKEVATRSWPLLLLFAGLSVVPAVQAVRNRRWGSGAIFSLILMATAIAGCFAPSRYQYQHFYAVTVVAALGILYLCKETVVQAPVRKAVLGVISAFAVISIIGHLPAAGRESRPDGWHAYIEARAMRDPALWFSTRYRQQFGVLQRYVPGGERILTLAPTAALIANRRIYPELATGVFGWRTARFVPLELRKKYHYVAPEDLAEYLRGRPPAGVLTGVEDPDQETALVEWAEANGYKRIELPKERVLWIPNDDYFIHRRFYRLEPRGKKKESPKPPSGAGEKKPPEGAKEE